MDFNEDTLSDSADNRRGKRREFAPLTLDRRSASLPDNRNRIGRRVETPFKSGDSAVSSSRASRSNDWKELTGLTSSDP
uniref:Uncharacterized protein n=1 Tax=Daphnia galeata TaxID=27404 RepID=A0A8J2S5E5_9CRUS|nr:unnamed protein product [Daphnia galeata]